MTGASLTGASTLTIEDSLIANLPFNGVHFFGTGTVKIANTTLRNNGSRAVYAQDGANVSISGTKMLGNVDGGVFAYSTTATTTTAMVSDSIISGGTAGIFASAGIAGATARIFVTRSTMENVFYALESQTPGSGSALVSVSNSMITKNGYAWYQFGTGSVVESAGNNHIRGNAFTSVGTLTLVGLQ
jgi:hypothetical protein